MLSEEHPLKALVPISLMVSGRSIWLRLEQLMKQYAGTTVGVKPSSKFTVLRFLQEAKVPTVFPNVVAPGDTEVTDAGMVTEVSFLLFEKASPPRDLMVEGIT